MILADGGPVNSRVLVFAREPDDLCSTLTPTTTATTTTIIIEAATIPVTRTIMTMVTGTPTVMATLRTSAAWASPRS